MCKCKKKMQLLYYKNDFSWNLFFFIVAFLILFWHCTVGICKSFMQPLSKYISEAFFRSRINYTSFSFFCCEVAYIKRPCDSVNLCKGTITLVIKWEMSTLQTTPLFRESRDAKQFQRTVAISKNSRLPVTANQMYAQYLWQSFHKEQSADC